MRIVYIAAGAGVMRCGACARDLTLVRGLSRRGHQVSIIPLYTPLRDDATGKSFPTAPVFYGGINVYLQQMAPALGRAPRFLTHLLDSPALLNLASSFAVKTTPADLGPMTVSVLAGQNGRQKRELAKLLRFLASDGRPDIVNITNSLLSGIAPAIKQQMRVPVVCTLQGEDEFVSAMPPEHAAEARRLMRENAASIDLFFAPGEAHAARMVELMGLPKEKVRVVRTGVETNGLAGSSVTPPAPPHVIGYLSVITPGKGLDLLVEAFRQLLAGGLDVRLRIAGQLLDKKYWKQVSAAASEVSDRVEYVGEVMPSAKGGFLRSLHVFALPSRFAEARGLAAMEAMAVGTPVVVPDSGVFPEAIELTGGGRLFESGNATDLAKHIGALLADPDLRRRTGVQAAEGIARFYSAEDMTTSVEQAYAALLP